MEKLLAGVAWVSMVFDDGSIMTFRTSLNKEFLNSRGIPLREGYLYDLDKMKFVRFREDAEQVNVYDEKPEYDSEVLKFASRFI